MGLPARISTIQRLQASHSLAAPTGAGFFSDAEFRAPAKRAGTAVLHERRGPTALLFFREQRVPGRGNDPAWVGLPDGDDETESAWFCVLFPVPNRTWAPCWGRAPYNHVAQCACLDLRRETAEGSAGPKRARGQRLPGAQEAAHRGQIKPARDQWGFLPWPKRRQLAPGQYSISSGWIVLGHTEVDIFRLGEIWPNRCGRPICESSTRVSCFHAALSISSRAASNFVGLCPPTNLN